MSDRGLFIIADGLNSSAASVAAAFMAGDAAWIRSRVRRYEADGVDAIDLCAAGVVGDESALLRWAIETVEPFSRCTLCVDSGDPGVLADVALGRARPPILNSIDVAGDWPEPLLAAIQSSDARVVVQLRRGHELPNSADDRVRWAGAAIDELEGCGITADRLFIDPVGLAWGPDFAAGNSYLKAAAELAKTFPHTPILSAISNFSWGYEQRSLLEREWLERVVDVGIGALLLDSTKSELMSVAGRDRTER